jgi:heme exporter protein A
MTPLIMAQHLIEIDDIVKNFGLNPVLRGVNLTLPQGQFLALVGANGAGKTTLLRIVATLSRPSAGEVRLGGWRLPGQASRVRRHIGLISHQPLLYGDLTAADNLHFFARLYQLPDSEKRVNRALQSVGLSARRRDPVRTFSRGMAQRLAIARATLHDPEILLLDEPYTGLDQEASHILTQLLAQEKDAGKTILMITHDFARGLELCDRVAILSRGKIALEIDRASMSLPELLTTYQRVTGVGK